MRSILGASILLVAVSAFAGDQQTVDPALQSDGVSQHLVLSPDHVLSGSETAALAARGIEVQKALSNGRLLVHVASPEGASMVARMGRTAPLTADQKVFRSAMHEASRGNAFARLTVFFHDDVDFDDAKRVIENAGGATADPMQVAFSGAGSIDARVPSSNLMRMAADDRVIFVYGPRRLPLERNNATSAAVSNVNVIQAPPYGLTGQGIVLSYFELAAADAAHQEFQGRLTVHFTGGSSSDVSHATHVGGTLIAAGIDPLAKGMAPSATLHEYSTGGEFGELLQRKQDLTNVQSVADNNSWGYVVGWCTAPTCTGWEWEDTAELYGYYDAGYTATLDKTSRATGVLYVHSAGNDARKTGPSDLWSTHAHVDQNGDRIQGKTYCYSRDKSGTDCPQPTCSAGAQYCEVTQHARMSGQLPDPWISVGITASAKNIITVGNVDTQKNIDFDSSRGPARDGRIKPEIVARGVGVYSSVPGGNENAHGVKSGTSMSSPVVTGTAGLLTEQWRRLFGGQNPGPTVLKALMIEGAQDVGPAGPDYTFGYGLLDAKASADLIIADSAQGRRIIQNSVAQGGEVDIPINVSATQKLRVTLGWDDPPMYLLENDPLDAPVLVNDLDLRVVDPSGNTVLPYVLNRNIPDALATRGVNTVDPTELVEIANAAPGIYHAFVKGSRVNAESPQKFVLIANAETSSAAAPSRPCTDLNEPNNTEATALGFVASGQTLDAQTCSAGDVDYYSFATAKAGQIKVTVTSTGTPLRVTLSSTATAPVSVDIPTNGTQSVTTQFAGSSAPTTFFVRVEAIGPIGSSTSYTISTVYPGAGAKKRGASH